MAIEKKELRIGTPRRKEVLDSNSERIYFGNDGNDSIEDENPEPSVRVLILEIQGETGVTYEPLLVNEKDDGEEQSFIIKEEERFKKKTIPVKRNTPEDDWEGSESSKKGKE